MSEHARVKTLAIRSAKWAFLTSFLSRFSQPVVSVVLARFLLPEDYGIVAMAALVTGLAGVFQGMGLSQALVQREKDVERSASVAFSLNVTFALFAYMVIYLAAPPIGTFFKETRVVPVLRVQGIALVLLSLSSAHIALLQRGFHFKKLFGLTVVPALMPICVAVPLAAAGFGYWALVVSFIAGTALQTVLLWVSSRWRPTLIFDKKLVLALVTFGGMIVLETLQDWAIISGANLVVGRFLGAEHLGRYVMGFNLATLAIGIWIRPFSAVVYSGFCRLRSDISEMRSSYTHTLQILATVVLPMALGLHLTAARLVPLLLGAKWAPVVPVIRILAIMPGLSWILAFKSDVYRAMGRPDIMPKILFAQMIYIIPVYLITAQMGLVAFCWGRFSMEAVFFLPHVIITGKLLKLSGDYFWKCIRSPLLASLVMCCAVYVLLRALDGSAGGVKAWASLLCTVAFGAVVYVVSLALIDRALSRRILRLAGRVVQLRGLPG